MFFVENIFIRTCKPKKKLKSAKFIMQTSNLSVRIFPDGCSWESVGELSVCGRRGANFHLWASEGDSGDGPERRRRGNVIGGLGGRIAVGEERAQVPSPHGGNGKVRQRREGLHVFPFQSRL